MIDESVPVSESVIFIANISVIRISVILHIGVSLCIMWGSCIISLVQNLSNAGG